VVGLALAVAGCISFAPAFVSAPASAPKAALPPLPVHWPQTLQLGMQDPLGDAAALRRSAPFGFRYQYLGGGVNTGLGWETWKPNGTFASSYAHESWAEHLVPVFSYYEIDRSKPGAEGHAQTAVTNLQDAETMRAYWANVQLLFQRIAGTKPVVVHVEPDLWGFLERRGEAALAAAFARHWLALRDRYAPNVLLAYHMSIWGTGHDINRTDPTDAQVRAYAAMSAAFYRALHTHFDLAFAEYSDRDAAWSAIVQHQLHVWYTPGDFHRHLLYMRTFVADSGLRVVLWQIPLGNTLMRAENNTFDHYQDNRVQWLLGPQGRQHLRAYAAAGVIGFLFGRGLNGNTCACDAARDGVTNPPPIDGNDRLSLSADDDGGYFRAQAAAYYREGALPLP
jgi:hypothetical protein